MAKFGPMYLEESDPQDSLQGSLREEAAQEAFTTPTTGAKLAATAKTFIPGLAGAATEGSIFSLYNYGENPNFDRTTPEAKALVDSVGIDYKEDVFNQGSLYQMKKKVGAIKSMTEANEVMAKAGIVETLLYSTLAMPFDPTLWVGMGIYSRVNAARKMANFSRKSVAGTDALLAGTENAASEALIQAASTEDTNSVGIAFATGILLGGGVSSTGNLIGHWTETSTVKRKFIKDSETADSVHKPSLEEEGKWVDEMNEEQVVVRTEDFSSADRIEIGGSWIAKKVNKIFGMKFTLSPQSRIVKGAYESKPTSDGHLSKQLAAVETTKYDVQTFTVKDKEGRVNLHARENVSDIQYALSGALGDADMHKTIGYKEMIEEYRVNGVDKKDTPTLKEFEINVEKARYEAEYQYSLSKEKNRNTLFEDDAKVESVKTSVEKELFETEALPDGTIEYVDKHMQEIAPFDTMTFKKEILAESGDKKTTLTKESEELEITPAQQDYVDTVMNQEFDKMARDMTPAGDISKLPKSIQTVLNANNRYSKEMADQAKIAGIDPRGAFDPEMYGHRMYDKDMIMTADPKQILDDFTDAILYGPRSIAKGDYKKLDFTVDEKMSGKLAYRKEDGSIILAADITAAKILKHIEFDKRVPSTSKNFVSEQKRYTTDFMKKEYGVDFKKSIEKMSDEEATEFLVLHEMEHNRQVGEMGDIQFKDEYFRSDQTIAGKGNVDNPWIKDGAIKLEAEANVNAITKVGERIAIRRAARLQADSLIKKLQQSENLVDMLFSKEKKTASALRRRSQSLDSTKISKYLNNNGAEVRQAYHYKMKGEVSTNKMFNTSDVEKYMDNLDPRIKGEERKLLRTMFETALGTRQIPSDPGIAYKNIARDIKAFNYLTDAGGFAKYGLSELGVAAAKLGFENVAKEIPAAARMVKEMYQVKDITANTPEAQNFRDIVRFSDAAEIYQNTNRSAIGDVSDVDTMLKSGYDTNWKNVASEKARGLQETMFRVSGLEAVTVFTKVILPRAFMGRLFDNLAAGKNISNTLERWGMTEQDMIGLKKILDEKNWDKDKFQDFDFASWKDQELAIKVQRTIGRMSRDVVLRHEALRLPAWMTDGDASAIVDLTKQFMSFSMMSYDKLLLAGLNDNKAMAAVGMISSGALLGAIGMIQEELLVAGGVKEREKAILPYNENAGKFFRRLAITQSYGSLPGMALELGGFTDLDGGILSGNFGSSASDVSKFVGGPALQNIAQLTRESSQFIGDPSVKEGLDIVRAITPMNNLIWYDWAVRAGISATGDKD